MLRNLEFVAHVVPDPLPDDEAPAVVLDVVGRLDEGDDGALVRVLRLAVDHRQLQRGGISLRNVISKSWFVLFLKKMEWPTSLLKFTFLKQIFEIDNLVTVVKFFLLGT